ARAWLRQDRPLPALSAAARRPQDAVGRGTRPAAYPPRSGHRVLARGPPPMNTAAEPRQPRAFDPADPSLIEEPLAEEPLGEREPEAGFGEQAEAQSLARPTQADLAQRGLRWGAVLICALAGAAALGLGASFARLVSAALVRQDWVG